MPGILLVTYLLLGKNLGQECIWVWKGSSGTVLEESTRLPYLNVYRLRNRLFGAPSTVVKPVVQLFLCRVGSKADTSQVSKQKRGDKDINWTRGVEKTEHMLMM